MVVDLIRSCYKTRMRFSNDPEDQGSLVQWYWTEPGAGRLPYPTGYDSRTWEYNEPWTWPVHGEILGGPRTFASGTRPTPAPATARPFPCGSPAQWSPAVPSAGEGAVNCCEVGMPPDIALHVRPEEVVAIGYADGARITLWPAASGTPRLLWQGNGPPAPFWQGGPLFGGSAVEGYQGMFISTVQGTPQNLVLGDFDLWMVGATISPPGIARDRAPGLSSVSGSTPTLRIGYDSTRVRINGSPNLTALFSANLDNGNTFLWRYRREGTAGQIHANRVLKAAGFTANNLTVAMLNGNRFTANLALHGSFTLLETLLWTRRLTAGETTWVMSYLDGRYPGIIP